ncbi:Leader peptidase PppA [Symmachiella dynata]|uniref:A24 family peptidase n=1 Tax=Symmachiella dynata TaxID=2527995 RepID=UPI00118D41F6|nr:A24 family peptidase [Symmachiella dynata]QDT47022.1 Leader peptidase PppA [Symmachiella dynata]
MVESAHAAKILRAVILVTAALWSVAAQSTLLAEDAPNTKSADDPARMSVIPAKPLHRHTVEEPPQSNWRFNAIYWYFAVCSFIIGACVGSFLNVVIYRLPLGMGLLRADSHCPRCKMPIAFRDNVPIFAWLKLRGRCRECAAPIPPRYMYVELATALIFLMLAFVELLSGGANLPGHTLVDTSVSPLAALNVELIGIYFTHCFLASALLCCVLIAADGHALPKSLVIPTIAVGLFSPFRADASLPLPSNWPAADVTQASLGLVVGGLLGACIGIAERYDTDGKKRQCNLAIVLAIIGGYLGWDLSLFAAGLTVIALLTVSLFGKHLHFLEQIPTVFFPAITVLLFIPFWSLWTAANRWSNLQLHVLVLICTVLVLIIISLFARHLRIRHQTPHNAITPV